MKPFVYTSQPARVVFGAGSLQGLGAEIDQLEARRTLVFCTPEQQADAERVAELIGPRCAGVYHRAAMHVPAAIAREATQLARDRNADSIVTIGGGSTIGLGKAVALSLPLAIIAVPTTYAGSEMTPIFGLTEDGRKTTGKDVRVLPKTVIYDPELSLDLPLPMSFSSGVNAMAHAAEGMYASDANPIMSLMAEEGIRALKQGLTAIASDARDLQARASCLYGAWLCGTVLGNVGMALHHKLCHTLGGTFNLPHAETHTVMLPQVLHYNALAAADAMQRVARALDTPTAAAGMYDWIVSLGLPVALKDLGMREADLDRCTQIALENAYANPRPLAKEPIRELLQNAYLGVRPAAAASAQA